MSLRKMGILSKKPAAPSMSTDLGAPSSPRSCFCGKGGILLLLAVALPVFAQYPGQVTKNAKESPELRSIAVLEWTGEEGNPKASRLVPVAVLDAGQLQDGGIYLARPEPLALTPEVEYELQQDGKPVGLFDIGNAGQQGGSWIGFGTWKPMPAAPRRPSAKELAKTRLDDDADGDQPVLHRKHHADEKPSSGGSSSDSGKNSGSGGDASGQAQPSDPDRPVLHKKPSSNSTDNSSAGSSTSSDSDRPVLKKDKKIPPPDVGRVESVPDDTDPDRPRLKRGKSSGPDTEVAPTLMGFPPDLQQTVAVSDTKSRPPHPWDYAWSNPDDEAKMKSSLENMARDALGLNPPPATAKPVTKRVSAAAKKNANPPPPPPPAPLDGEQFRVFELAYHFDASGSHTRASRSRRPGPGRDRRGRSPTRPRRPRPRAARAR